jgi:uncharacterized membrane protein YbhN (UPF0104 family)
MEKNLYYYFVISFFFLLCYNYFHTTNRNSNTINHSCNHIIDIIKNKEMLLNYVCSNIVMVTANSIASGISSNIFQPTSLLIIAIIVVIFILLGVTLKRKKGISIEKASWEILSALLTLGGGIACLAYIVIGANGVIALTPLELDIILLVTGVLLTAKGAEIMYQLLKSDEKDKYNRKRGKSEK